MWKYLVSADRNIKSADLVAWLLMKVNHWMKTKIWLNFSLFWFTKVYVVANWAAEISLKSGLFLIIEMSFKFDILIYEAIKILIIQFLAIRNKHAFCCLIELDNFHFLRVKYVTALRVFDLQYNLADILRCFKQRLRLWCLIKNQIILVWN